MPIVTPTAIAITDTPSVLIADGTDASMSDRIPIVVQNVGTDEVYLGGLGVTPTIGVSIIATEKLSIDLGPGDKLYGICAAGETATVRVLKARS